MGGPRPKCSDKDFIQLHTYPNVNQYDCVNKKFIEHPDPVLYLKEQILIGDAGDDVPNYLMPDNTFVAGIRQKPMTKSRLAVANQNPSNFCTDEALRSNYTRNQQLIDLSFTPIELQRHIMTAYEDQAGKNKSLLQTYFIKKGLKNLLGDIQSF